MKEKMKKDEGCRRVTVVPSPSTDEALKWVELFLPYQIEKRERVGSFFLSNPLILLTKILIH